MESLLRAWVERGAVGGLLVQADGHGYGFRRFQNPFLGVRKLMIPTPNFNTCDLCDAHKADDDGRFRVLPPVFLDFGGVGQFAGPVYTVKCFEDNTLVKEALDTAGAGRVLVVDGAGSLRRALVGGNLAKAAARNGWAGIVVDGCVRDVAELRAEAVGIRALAAMPLPTEKRQQGLQNDAVQIQGVWVRPGDWLYADADGIVVYDQPLV